MTEFGEGIFNRVKYACESNAYTWGTGWGVPREKAVDYKLDRL